MLLKSFRVVDFRSVVDSGWVDVDQVTALIGTNESGKTNLLLPLWKLNPANDGEIDPIPDYPRNKFHILRDQKEKPIFIQARFELEPQSVSELARLTEDPEEFFGSVVVSRDYSGQYTIEFPDAQADRHIERQVVASLLTSATDEITGLSVAAKADETRRALMIEALTIAKQGLPDEDYVSADSFRHVIKAVKAGQPDAGAKRTAILSRFDQVLEDMTELLNSVTKDAPSEIEGVFDLVMEQMPHFVYYSNYGNLDSEIYLPHVIDNLNRKGLGAKEEAKARTLKVLFNFVKLQPKEIRELGAEVVPEDEDEGPTDEEISETAKRKKERDVLLQAAGTQLTARFREWWKQGDYRFRFQADGDHFRIWVSDDRRPEDIELENRSTGLQWFLSFFLIFLVESLDSHKNSILLLDEPGLSLHPLAQEDLSKFFEGLADTNQLLYTTHSPFLVDPDHLERVKSVYVGERGATTVSSNLKAAVDPKSAQSRSVYPVFAALGMSISKSLLLGCKTVIVEGQSDQFYLSAMKSLLIGAGLIRPSREVLFVPAWGVRGVKAIVSILTGIEDSLPSVLVDSDQPGRQFADSMRTSVFSSEPAKVVEAGSFSALEGSVEVEDLVPVQVVLKVADRLFRSGSQLDFSDQHDASRPIVPQIEAFAKSINFDLEEGWKVGMARDIKQRLMKDPPGSEVLNQWKEIFVAMGCAD